MNTISKMNSHLHFLAGGGEMGELIREKDWSKTPLGEPSTWPQSLKTMVSVMLDNPFGMYIAWGKEYIQIYNDGYRPILGANKHPQALGIGTPETFSEIWHIIDSMFGGVMEGKAVGFPDFMLPLNRNGFVEECYFDFSYSPIRKENGEVGGVLVTVIETTNKKKAELALKESELRFRNMADNIPNLAWMADANGWIYWYNKQWYDYTGTTAQQMEGWGWQSVHDPKELPRVLTKWKAAIVSGRPFEMVFPLKGADGKYRQFLTRILPMFDNEGKLYQWFGTNTDITERIKFEQSLKESELRFRNMAESINILVATSDESSNATYFNKAWTELTGRQVEELLNYGWADLIHEDDRQSFINLYKSAFEKQENWSAEFRVRDKQGQYRWVLAKGIARFHSPKSFAGYISSSIDITERIIAESKLRESEQNLRNTILKAPVAMCIFKGPKYVVELANERMFEIWGRPAADVMNKPIFDGLPEARNHGFEALLDGVLATGIAFSAEDFPVTLLRDGKVANVYVNFLYEAYREADGSITGIIAACIDVTAQVVARKAIESAYEQFNTLTETIPQIVWTALPDGNLDYFSKQWWAYSGLNYEQSVGAGWAVTVYEEDLPRLLEHWKHSLETGEPYQVEARLTRFDGKNRWFLIRAIAIKENGNIIQWVGTCTDIHDQKDYEQQLQDLSSQLVAVNEELTSSNDELNESNNQLKSINADLDNFIYTASHDLKAPILNIEGLMNALKDSLSEETLKNEYVELTTRLIDTSIARFKKTINELTDISKLQNEINQDASKISILDMIKDIELDLQMQIQQSNATIETKIEEHTTLYFSDKNLRSIIYNLISNAIKYSSPHRHPSIIIDYKTEGEYQVLSVSDNGLGIDLSYQDKLFSIFGRLHDHVEGSGVGLYIVKKIIENAGGKIEVESELGIGSTFYIYFKSNKRH